MRLFYKLLMLMLFAGAFNAQAAGVVKLSKNGKSNWRIYQQPQSGTVIHFAAAELQKYLHQLCGANVLPVNVPKSNFIIKLGLRGKLGSIKGIAAKKAVFDGYSVLISPKQIVIAGDDEIGILYGVYDLLEHLGCRWYQPTLDKKDPEIVPFNKNLNLSAGTWAASGKIELRIYNGSSFFFELDPKRMLPQLDWAAKNRYNGISWQAGTGSGKIASQMEDMKNSGILAEIAKRGLFLHGPGHSFPYFLSSDKYYKDHPEWFGLYKGRRLKHGGELPLMNYCWSNADANNELIKNIEAYLKKYPQYKIFMPVWIDGGAVCQCANCQKRGAANLIVDLFNQISDHLAKTNPSVTLEAVIGYPPVEQPPTSAVPNGKWQSIYAHWGRSFDQSYNDTNYNKKDNMAAWTSYFKNKVEICSYYASASHEPINSPPYLHALQGDMDYLVKNNIRGDFVMQYPHGFWWNASFDLAAAGLYAYYYPGRNPKDELKDYVYSYFGKQSGSILLPYFEKFADNLRVSYYAAGGGATDADMKWLNEAGKIIEQAQKTEKDSVYAYRIAKLASSQGILEHWGNGHQYLTTAKAKAADLKNNKAGKADVLQSIEAGRQYAKALLSYAADQQKKYPGTIDANWLESWYVNRTLLEPLTAIEKQLQ